MPFCLKKCSYCGFISFAGYAGDVVDSYFDELLKEIDAWRAAAGKQSGDVLDERAGQDKFIIDTVFFGGGTPTLAGPEKIKKVIERISPFLADGAEITMEANPKTFDEESLRAYRSAGVNRLSIGCQSLEDSVLERLGRVHTRAEFIESYEAARRAGFSNINIDLMFAVPGQDMGVWKETLYEAIALGPEHISAYSLQIEEGTPFYNEYKYGRLDAVSDEEERRMHHEAIRILEAAGYEHYEISNFARRGEVARECEAERAGAERRGCAEGRSTAETRGDYRCQHNLKYWNMDEYLGVGLGASSFLGGLRFKNTDDLDEYLAGKSPKRKDVIDQDFASQIGDSCLGTAICDRIVEVHKETVKDLAGEMVFTGLRKRSGFLKSRFEEIVGVSYDDFYRYIYNERKRFIEEGLLVETDERVYLTEEGIDRSNDIMSEFV